MPRFFFNSRDSRGTILDDTGTTFAGVKEAHAVAVALAGDLIRDLGMSQTDDTSLAVWVTNIAGETVCTLDFTTTFRKS